MLEPLRLTTCGSVDDGKSTLIGRLLWDSQLVFDDHAKALVGDSHRYGTQGNHLDFALLLDGLQAEREQNITIDVAYRFFATPRRRFIVADCPGHEEYTRNMATGASHSDLAILVCNASKGLLTQTYRHARIAALLGVRHIVLAVNKMDMVGWNESVFRDIVQSFEAVARTLNYASVYPIPVCALNGDNITGLSAACTWYSGVALLAYLEEVNVSSEASQSAFRMPVQLVNRPDQHFRGYCGRITSGHVDVGDCVRVVPGGQKSVVRNVLTAQSKEATGFTGDSVTLQLQDEIDIPRGSVICAAEDPIEMSDQFETVMLSLADQLLVAHRHYIVRIHTAESTGFIRSIRSKLDPTTGDRTDADSLDANEIGFVDLQFKSSVPFERYATCRKLGSFIVIDPVSNETIGAGIIVSALRRSERIYWQALEVNKAARAAQLMQKPRCLWFTGLPASGKSTIANLLEKRLFASGRHSYLLDGDNVRHGLNRDLGFIEADRNENIRRTAEVAKLFVDAGLIVLVSFVSPYVMDRTLARSLFETEEFVEIFVDAPVEECEKRDPKGLYRKARRGEIINMTGVDAVYEAPPKPELHLSTIHMSPSECVERILRHLSHLV